MKRTLDQQIAEVGREIGLRKNLYPGMVARGKLRQGEADEATARMEAAYETLAQRSPRAGACAHRAAG